MSVPNNGKGLPPFLKQFDPFSTLEPERLAASAPQDNNLKNTNEELSGSFLSVKKEANVLDLFDNLFVTPQQVSSNGPQTSIDEEFSKFLDRFETPKVGKLIDIPSTNETESQNVECQTEMHSKEMFPKAELLGKEELIDKLLLNMCMKGTSTQNPGNSSKDDHKQYCRKDVKANNIGSNSPINRVIHNQTLGKHNPTPTKAQQCKVIIETVTKDPKVFLKRRIVKPEAVTAKYSKGADLYEKSIVLPQIMERLTKWKTDHDTKKNMPRKLLLDTNKTVIGNKENNSKVNPIVEPKCQCQKLKQEPVSAKIDAAGVDLKSKAKTSVNSTPSTSADRSKSTNLDKLGINTSGLKDIQRGILKALISNPDKSLLESKDANAVPQEVKLNPEVLMEDCNKQRLTEFTRRQLFQKFVNGEI